MGMAGRPSLAMSARMDAIARSDVSPRTARRVLVVEDDRDTRELLVEALRMEGYEVAAAPDGVQALEHARRVQPHVILLDLMMPVMSGWEFRAMQTRDPSLSSVPVIVMSAFSDTLAGTASVPKPFDIDEMVDAIRRCAA